MVVGHLLANVGHLGAHFKHDALDAAGRMIATRRTLRLRALQVRRRHGAGVVDQFIGR